MKYIAKYPKKTVDAKQAAEAHTREFYRRPCNIINGKSLGEFVETSDGVKEFIYADGKVRKIKDRWLEKAASELFAHLKENTHFVGIQGINSFETTNSLHSEALAVEENYGFKYHLRIGAGYTAYISQGGEKVLAEAYVACSGNAAIVIHKEDESVLFVNSRRHGIPELALGYAERQPHEIVMYDSWRTDAKWHESGLENPNDPYENY